MIYGMQCFLIVGIITDDNTGIFVENTTMTYPNETLIFDVIVTKDDRTAYATIQVRMLNGIPPAVIIK